MSSVRPICAAEEQLATGQPMHGFFTFFGLTQGILLHLSSQGISAKGNWFPNPKAKFAGLMFIGGGFVSSYLIGKKLFEDPQLMRLRQQHAIDVAAEKLNH